MPKHTGLGKGLEALIPTGFKSEGAAGGDFAPVSNGILTVPVDQITSNPRQPHLRRRQPRDMRPRRHREQQFVVVPRRRQPE